MYTATMSSFDHSDRKEVREHVPPEAMCTKRESPIAIKHRLKASNYNGFQSRAGGGVSRSNKDETICYMLLKNIKEHLLTRDAYPNKIRFILREGGRCESQRHRPKFF